MRNRFLGISALLLAVSLMLTVLSACVTEEAAVRQDNDYWSKKGGDCEIILKAPHAYDVGRLAECTKKWEMYRLVDQIPLEMRSMYAVAFSIVSHKSPLVYDRAVADAALARICIPRHPIDASGNIREVQPTSLECTPVSKTIIGGTGVRSTNAYANLKRSVTIKPVSSSKENASNASMKNGDKKRNKNALDEARKYYEEALEHNPYNAAAKYNLAGVYALMGNTEKAVNTLEELYSWDDDTAEMKISKASTDSDFISLRENPKFKLITGYFRLVIINGAGSFGNETVKSIQEKLNSRNFNVAEVNKSSTPLFVPQIFYKVGFDAYAQRIKDILAYPNMTLTLNKDVNSPNDIVVMWGQPEASQLSSAGKTAPTIQGTRSGGLNPQDALKAGQDVLKGAKDAQGAVDGAKSTATSIGTTFTGK